MRELIRAIAATPGMRLDAVLHLGAGACAEMQEYLAIKPRALVLVEADPQLAEALRAELEQNAGVEVIAAAAAPNQGRATLRVMNNRRESTLQNPGALLERLPNLRIAREVGVPAMTLAQLAARLRGRPGEEASGDAALVLELQGAELAVLRSAPREVLRRFSWIAVRASAEVLFEGGAHAAELDAFLHEAGFRLLPQASDGTDWPYQPLLYRRDERAQRLEALDGEVRAGREELEKVAQRAALTTKLHALREADLRELQERYGAALSVQERQRELLVKLSERLSAAAGYFRELSASQPALEFPADATPQPPVRGRRHSDKAP
jgi:FkbM family methyltransferase